MISIADLPTNARGAVFHLDLLPEEVADIVITVGDPSRVMHVSKHFDSIEVQRAHREFVTHTGYIGKQRLTVLSTGIGVPPIDIVMTELDALVNIDLKARIPKAETRSLTVLRLGTTGTLQAERQLGDVLITRFAIGFDNLLEYYRTVYLKTLDDLRANLTQHLAGGSSSFYLTEADTSLVQHFAPLGTIGITATCDGFYGPQGRNVRVPLRYPNLLQRLISFEFLGLRVINFEMETAGILGMGQLLGHRCLSISAVIANRINKTFSSDFQKSMEEIIIKTLPYLCSLR
jgi:uridine phosphorylase